MLNGQELDQKGIDNKEDAEAVLGGLRNKVPPLLDLQRLSDPHTQEVSTAVKSKIDDLLRGYPDDPQKRTVSELLGDTITEGCLSYEIDPVELIVVPRELEEDQIAMVDNSKKIGPVTIKNFFVDPYEIMFRVQLLSRYGLDTSKNITDMVFVTMHEMAHLGQSAHAEGEYQASKRFGYSERPTERHADEVALKYCKDLLAFAQTKPTRNDGDNILLRGLPETIKQVETNRRPLM